MDSNSYKQLITSAWGNLGTVKPANPPNRKNRVSFSSGRISWNSNSSAQNTIFVLTNFNLINQTNIIPARFQAFSTGASSPLGLYTKPKIEVYVTPKRGSAYWMSVSTLSLLNSEVYLKVAKNNSSSFTPIYFRNSFRNDFSEGGFASTLQWNEFPVGKLKIRNAYSGRGLINDNYVSNLETSDKTFFVMPTWKTSFVDSRSFSQLLQLPTTILEQPMDWAINSSAKPIAVNHPSWQRIAFVVNSTGSKITRLVQPYDAVRFKQPGLTSVKDGKLEDFFEYLYITSSNQLVYQTKAGLPSGASAWVVLNSSSRNWQNNMIHQYVQEIVIR